MNKISVIVPTYNQAHYLPMTLDSIMFQSHPDVEIIVVDDGSTDGTAETLRAYLDAVAGESVSYACNFNDTHREVERRHHPRYQSRGRSIKVLTHQKNQGLGQTLNTGVAAVDSELCTFIASDDMLLPTALEALELALDRDGADFAYADMHVVNDQGRILRKFALPDYSFEACFCTWYLCGICKLYRRDLHRRFGLYDTAIKPQDHEMFLRFAMNGARFVHVPQVLANVRHHGPDREVHNHTPENWNRLYAESAELVLQARRHAAAQAG